MSTVTLSFIVPVRDDAARLRRCLRSIAGDPSPVPFELIVADNGSTDDSPEVATTAGARVLSLPGQPVAELRNRAAAAATGDLLARMKTHFREVRHVKSPASRAESVELYVVALGFKGNEPRGRE